LIAGRLAARNANGSARLAATQFIPDMLPVIGFADDAVAAHITPLHRAAARAALARGLK